MGREEFKLLAEPKHIETLREKLDIDVEQLVASADFLFRDADFIDIQEFKKHLMDLQGSKTATVKDLLDLKMFVHYEMAQCKSCWRNVNDCNRVVSPPRNLHDLE